MFGRSKNQTKFQFDFQISSIEGLPEKYSDVRVQLSRSNKTTKSKAVSVTDGAARFSEVDGAVSLVATLLQDMRGKFDEKSYKFSILRLNSKAKRGERPIGTSVLNLAQYAKLDGRDDPLDLAVKIPEHKSLAVVKMRIKSTWLRNSDGGIDSATTFSALSKDDFGSTGTASDEEDEPPSAAAMKPAPMPEHEEEDEEEEAPAAAVATGPEPTEPVQEEGEEGEEEFDQDVVAPSMTLPQPPMDTHRSDDALALAKQNTQLQREVEDLRHTVADLNGRLASRDNELRQLRASMVELSDGKKKKKKKKDEESEWKVIQANNEVKEASQQIERLRDEIADLKESRAEADENMERLRERCAENEASRSEVDGAVRENATLKEQLKEARLHVQQLEENHASQTIKLTEMTTQCSTSQARVKELEEQASDTVPVGDFVLAKMQLAEFQDEIDRLRNELKRTAAAQGGEKRIASGE